MTETMSDFEKDLVPSNPNLTKIPSIKKIIKIRTDVTAKPSKPKMLMYSGDSNPFKNAREFNSYYRSFLNFAIGKEVEFDHRESECLFAAQVLDLLIERRKDNKIFLNAWLKYFCDIHLKGKKYLKVKYTSIKKLKDTFEKFNGFFQA